MSTVMASASGPKIAAATPSLSWIWRTNLRLVLGEGDADDDGFP
jgi:hypothetical protein